MAVLKKITQYAENQSLLLLADTNFFCNCNHQSFVIEIGYFCQFAIFFGKTNPILNKDKSLKLLDGIWYVLWIAEC